MQPLLVAWRWTYLDHKISEINEVLQHTAGICCVKIVKCDIYKSHSALALYPPCDYSTKGQDH